MGRQERESRCRKHPKHKELKGVCPSCLREKLTQLSATSSNLSSPSAAFPRQHPSQPLDKSRSLATLLDLNMDDAEEKATHKEKKIKKGKFWSKLLVRKEEDGLLHSKTMKEKASTKWVLF